MHEAIEREVERTIPAAEIERELTRHIGAEERDDVLALVRWFTDRYPTPAERLSYVRRAYARWATSLRDV